jgi:hypothetical protein
MEEEKKEIENLYFFGCFCKTLNNLFIWNMARNIYYQSMFGHFSIEITKHLQN